MNNTKDRFPILLLFLLFAACHTQDDQLPPGVLDHRQAMRDFVINLSAYAKDLSPAFVIIPQNGIELVSTDGEEDGAPHTAYLAAIDGNGQEDLFYGYNKDDKATPAQENAYLQSFLQIAKTAGKIILVTDYCSTPANMDDARAQNSNQGYLSFAADHRELDNIPNYPATIHNPNNGTITSLSQAKNFLYLINPENFSTKSAFIDAIRATNYDLLIMDLFFHDGTAFSKAEIDFMKRKANGGSRMMIAYLSIGEAEDYRYYWQSSWKPGNPSWIEAENPDWAGNYKVRYWDREWQQLIYGNEQSYLKRIIDAGFDGAYLDIIDAFEYFE